MSRRLLNGNRFPLFYTNIELQNKNQLPKHVDTTYLVSLRKKEESKDSEECPKSTRGDGSSIYDCENELWTHGRED